MAKTLIGNIKGKDGRGVASIIKTGTTGSVDTYTITYTDNSTSTYTVNNSSSISLQRQIVPSAAVESSATASQAYEAGDYVVVNGVLRKVKSAIAKGNAISDYNSTATTVGGELATLGDSVTHYDTKNKSWTQDNWNILQLHMFGSLYYFQIQRTYSTFGGASGTEILTLDGVHPYSSIQLALTGYVATVAVIYGAARIDPNGKVTINAPSYGSAVTVLVSGYVLLS